MELAYRDILQPNRWKNWLQPANSDIRRCCCSQPT